MNIITLDEKLMLGHKPDIQLVENSWVAGGAIRSWFNKEKTRDIDLFFKDKEAVINFKKLNKLENIKPTFSSKTTEQFEVNENIIQIIYIFSANVEETFDKFDFTICQFAWDGKIIYTTTEALVSISRNHLGVHKIQKGYETDSLRRAFKYYEKGYKPCLGTIRDLALAISDSKTEEIEEQITISPGGMPRHNVRWD